MSTSTTTLTKRIVHIATTTEKELDALRNSPVVIIKSTFAIQYIEEYGPEIGVILVDHRAELTTSRRLLTRIKRLFPEIPVIIFSPVTVRGLKVMALGADGYLNTSSAESEIEEYLKRFLGARGVDIPHFHLTP